MTKQLIRKLKNRIIDKINKSEDIDKVLQTARIWKVRVPRDIKNNKEVDQHGYVDCSAASIANLFTYPMILIKGQ